MEADRILRPKDQKEIFRLSLSTQHEHARRGEWPPNFKLGPGAVGIWHSEGEAVMRARAAGKPVEEIKRIVRVQIAQRQQALKR